jgi:hypothetical protein
VRALILMMLVACRTQPLADLSPPSADLSSPRDLSSLTGQVVSCGRDQTCSIAAGEHCCEGTPLFCSTGSCFDFREYDCDGPEDCPGGVCCFHFRTFPGSAACAADCPGEGALCHSQADCASGFVCCLNFVLGPGDGLCLGACD